MAKTRDEEILELEPVKLLNPKQGFDYGNGKVILSVKHLKQFFQFGRGKYKYTKAVNDVSFDIYKGEVFGLVGESGCGKTTTGRSIIKLYKLTSGDVWFKGVRIAAGTRWNEKEIKFTKKRLTKALKDLKEQEKAELKDVKDADKAQEIRTKYDKLRSDKIAEASKIIQNERVRIRQAKHDDKYCNKDMSKREIARVEEKYAYLKEDEYVQILKDPNHPRYAEVSREAANYKKKLVEAKQASITRKMQMIFQDPIASLNPRMTVRNIIAEGLIIKGVKDKKFIDEEVKRVLELVGLLPEHANRYPHEFSGGQRQRIGIARAIIMNPELIIADEPVSALDVSIQAQVINLLNDLRENLGLTILFIAHNLSVVKYFCDRIAVMYYGKLMELATSEELFAHPFHPYTKSLLSAVPHPDPNIEKGRTRVTYNPFTDHDYSVEKPSLREIYPGHFVRCSDSEAKVYLKEYEKAQKAKAKEVAPKKKGKK